MKRKKVLQRQSQKRLQLENNLGIESLYFHIGFRNQFVEIPFRFRFKTFSKKRNGSNQK